MDNKELVKVIDGLDKIQQEWDSVLLARSLAPILKALAEGVSIDTSMIGDLSQLATEEKDNLVQAINSLNSDLNYLLNRSGKGSTADRPDPQTIVLGYMYFDTDLGFPIWWDGSKWIDAMGSNADPS